MSNHIIRSPVDAASVFKSVVELEPSEDNPLAVTIEPYKNKRTISANALSHVWYNDIAIESGTTPLYEKCFCKLHFGVPILRAEDPLFASLYNRAILNTFSYEEKIKLMKILPVTSRMNTDQMCRYLDHMQKTLAEERNIILRSLACKEYEDYQQAKVNSQNQL